MKSMFIGFIITATSLTACNSGNNKTGDAKQNGTQKDTSGTAGQVTTDTGNTKNTASGNATPFATTEIVTGYLQLKNALTKDNGRDAAAAGNTIIAALDKVDKSALTPGQLKTYTDLQDDIKEHAEHIGTNAGKIEHQREHFGMLSKDIADLVKTFGNGGQTLYKDFCPMANGGKGSIWISEIKEIKNPYYGSKMISCGSVKETIK